MTGGDGILWAMKQPVRSNLKKRRKLFLAEWRKHRGLSQGQLADRVGTTQGHISHLETGRNDYSGELLEILADALGCEPVDLLMRNPADPAAPWSIWDQIPAQTRPQAIEILSTFAKKKHG